MRDAYGAVGDIAREGGAYGLLPIATRIKLKNATNHKPSAACITVFYAYLLIFASAYAGEAPQPT